MHPNYALYFHSICLVVATAICYPSAAAVITMNTANTTTKQGCIRQCGNVTIPYPFGIGLDAGCSLSPLYDVFCNLSSNPPMPLLLGLHTRLLPEFKDVSFPPLPGLLPVFEIFEIVEISEMYIRIRTPVITVSNSNSSLSLLFPPILIPHPFSFSSTYNKLVVIGCQETGFTDFSSCSSTCSSAKDVAAGGQCDGSGCCRAAIPAGSNYLRITLVVSANRWNVVSFNPYGYAFIAEEGSYNFGGLQDLNDPNFAKRVMNTVTVALDWVIFNGPCVHFLRNQALYDACLASLYNQHGPPAYGSCEEARRHSSTYACMANTACSDQLEDATEGYKCSCKSGFQGNPYLSPGCTDVDECADPILNNCSMACTNTVGGFNCSCPPGYSGDGRIMGSGCNKKNSLVIKFSLGISLGLVFAVTSLSLLCIMDRERRLTKKKKKFFRQNGGWLLKEKLSMTKFDSSMEQPTNIFTEKELNASTNNFHQDHIIGQGGYGTVYKGVLQHNHQIVAIKKSKMVDQNQIEQFINELVILGQVNHRNVVKLLGCCLETEVPLLVYEFIPNGTLYSHIHENQSGEKWQLNWNDCLRIASETADALSYLHSAANPPIIHRDVKSMNILLEDDYTAKMADFGGSRLIPMDQSQLPTIVQGTLGYLDPEYLHSSMLTEKSDVYSFGVVLAELLTRQKPLSAFRLEEDRNLSIYFIRSFEQGRIFDILDPRWFSEASTSELASMASITQRCLQLSRRDRPTMREVFIELEAIKKLKKQQQTQTTKLLRSFSVSTESQSSMLIDEDLYPIPPQYM